MDFLLDLLAQLRDLESLVATAGYVGVTAIIFIETGLLFPFLPGDSLLVTAGLVAAAHNPLVNLNVWTLGVLCSIAAVVGDQIAYGIGRRSGEALFTREDSRWFKQSHLRAAHEFYEKHGGKTIILARFVPIVRTFAPFVAGSGAMNYSRFMFFNITGALLWLGLILPAGWFFGNFEIVKRNFELVVLGIIFMSVLPMVFEVWKAKREHPSRPVAK